MILYLKMHGDPVIAYIHDNHGDPVSFKQARKAWQAMEVFDCNLMFYRLAIEFQFDIDAMKASYIQHRIEDSTSEA